MADSAAVLGKVFEAFKDAPYPGDERLIRPHCGRCLEIQQDFARARRTESWITRPLDSFKPCSLNTAVLTEEAYRYYFPLLAAVVLLEPVAADVFADQMVLDFRAAGGRIAALSAAQQQAAAAFFEHLASVRPGEPD